MRRFAFIMDPLAGLSSRWDTSLCLVRALQARGHQIFYFLPEDLSRASNQIRGKGRRITYLGKERYAQGPSKEFRLAGFDAVFIRKDPPFDRSYLTLTYLLDPLPDQTCVINHPTGIRNANEKIIALKFSKWCPATLISSQPEEILKFQKTIKRDLVIKPLYNKGGEGVFLLKDRATLQKATQKGKNTVIAQEYLPLPKEGGDKRILLWKGKVLGAFWKIPRPGEFRSNLSLAGARFRASSLTASEKKLMEEINPVLLREGLFFTGVDVRGGKLIEINVTSPAGLVELDELYGGASESIAKEVEKM